jgi:hypothetical protein
MENLTGYGIELNQRSTLSLKEKAYPALPVESNNTTVENGYRLKRGLWGVYPLGSASQEEELKHILSKMRLHQDGLAQ